MKLFTGHFIWIPGNNLDWRQRAIPWTHLHNIHLLINVFRDIVAYLFVKTASAIFYIYIDVVSIIWMTNMFEFSIQQVIILFTLTTYLSSWRTYATSCIGPAIISTLSNILTTSRSQKILRRFKWSTLRLIYLGDGGGARQLPDTSETSSKRGKQRKGRHFQTAHQSQQRPPLLVREAYIYCLQQSSVLQRQEKTSPQETRSVTTEQLCVQYIKT